MKDGVLHQPVDSGSRQRVLARLAQVLGEDPRVDFAFVYGSFAEDRPFHDVDVGIQIQSDRCDGVRVADHAMAPLEERLAAAAGFPVDLVVLNGRPATFLFHVYRGRVILARSEARLTSELEQTMRTYFDIAPVLRHATREAFGT
jgi:predicted nucleotidyltransferase